MYLFLEFLAHCSHVGQVKLLEPKSYDYFLRTRTSPTSQPSKPPRSHGHPGHPKHPGHPEHPRHPGLPGPPQTPKGPSINNVSHSDLKCPITFGNAKMSKMHIFEKF